MNDQPSPTSSELSPLKRALLAIDEMRGRLAVAERAMSAPIAVVGLGCRFPGASSPQEYWQLLIDGVDAVGPVPSDRWDEAEYFDPDPLAPGKLAHREGGFLADVRGFEPQFFGISPREAISMDPQQRMLLEVAWEALEHAGIAPDSLGGSRTGVFVGVATNDYATVQLNASGLDGLDAYYATGVAHSVTSGRLSYVLGLRGPAMAIDTACSSSLVAVHLAVQSLRMRDADLALAGGVNLILAPDNSITLSKYQMLSPDSRCKAFDSRADGFARGEGCGLVVLKRLDDALSDGDNVLAVIRGSAINQDGASSGLTAPNGPSQVDVIRDALADAGVAPSAIGYVEAHGTGTALGDPIEIQAIDTALGTDRDGPVAVGSVKTNIGHLEAVAGVAGLIKAVLAVGNAEIPPHLHLVEPNPHVEWASMNVVVPTRRTPWGGHRIAGVSAFGFSGTNAHVVVEQPPSPPATSAPVGNDAEADGRSMLVTLSARTDAALRATVNRYAAHLTEAPGLRLADVCRTSNSGRAHLAHRAAFVASTVPGLVAALGAFDSESWPPGVVVGCVPDGDAARVGFLCTGQGSQFVGMGRGLYGVEPVFRSALDRCASLLGQIDVSAVPWWSSSSSRSASVGLLEVLFASDDDEIGSLLGETCVTQPALFALEYALAALWNSWGVTPAVVSGHSVGEYVAATLAGVFSVEDGVALVAARGRLMQALPPGGSMMAVFATERDVAEVIADASGGGAVSVAAVNGPAHVVVSGERTGVDEIGRVFEGRGVRVERLVVSHAFHSPLMAPMLDEFARVARSVTYRVPTKRLISNVTGGLIGAEVAAADYWIDHVMAPVRFADGIAAMRAYGVDTYVEIGPHPVLCAMAGGAVDDDDVADLVWIPSLRRKRDDQRQMLDALASLYVRGVGIDWRAVASDQGGRPVELPTYPFEREEYWVESRSLPQKRRRATHPLLGDRLDSPLDVVVFDNEVHLETYPYVDDHRVFGLPILPATGFIEIAIAGVAATTEASPDTQLAVEDLLILEGLVVGEHGPTAVQTIFEGTSHGDTFGVHSKGPGASEWRLHATGRIGTGRAGDGDIESLGGVRERCGVELLGAAHYETLRERGLDFGPSLHGVHRVQVGDREALGEIRTSGLADFDRYRVHPALLDAALQTIAPATSVADATYLPFSIERIVLLGRPTVNCWSHVKLRPGADLATRPEIIVADVVVYDDGGSPFARVDGVALKHADRASLQRLARQRGGGDVLYEVDWVPLDDGGAASTGLPALEPAVLAAAAAARAPGLAVEHDLEHYQGLLDAMERASTDYIIAALRDLGLTLDLGERFTLDRVPVDPRHRALLAHLAGFLVSDGLVVENDGVYSVVDVAQVDSWNSERWDALAERFPMASGELEITRRCGESLGAALTGEVDPLELLFPAGSLDSAEQMYEVSPFAHYFNSLAGEAVAAAVATAGDRRLRVLEIGAGTGGTTAHVLPRLPADRTDYVFTDVSAHFLTRARRKFERYPFVDYRTLDIEADLGSQGIGSQGFDVIVAANVLHATADLRRTFDNVGRLMAPGGVLVMTEMVRPLRFISISFGLTDGWWKFADTDLRPSSLLLDAPSWQRFLGDRGLGEPSVVLCDEGATREGTAPPATSLQAVFVAGAPSAHASIAGTSWLVVGGGGLGAALVAELERSGGTVTAVAADVPSTEFDGVVEHCRFDSIIDLGHLDGAGDDVSEAEVRHRGLARSLGRTKALVERGHTGALCFVTRGATAAGFVAPDPEQALLWGFAKSVAVEHPELGVRCVDLDAGQTAVADLLETILTTRHEDQLAVRSGRRFGARLAPARGRSGRGVARELTFDRRGTLDELIVRPTQRRRPGPGEVEIEVAATGLNFKDVLNVLDMYPGEPGPLGGECSGVVVAVGDGVTDVEVNDAVIAVTAGAFRSFVTCPANLVVPKPSRLPFVDAAGILIPYATAHFSLLHLGRLAAGERVLVHAGAGGVGLAAIAVARRLGAEVYATAGSDRKRTYLRSLGVEHVYDSRSLDFADQIRTDCAGDGVDVVLNSLAGDAVRRSLGLLRNGGRFLEIGKSDHLDAEQSAALPGGVEYHVIDWGATASVDPDLIRTILLDTVEAVGDGRLPPLPVTAFPFEQAPRAFRFMAQAQQIGKVVVVDDDAEVDPVSVHSDASYLITGGLRGLGLATAEHLVSRGARHVVLMGRSAPTDDSIAVIESLCDAGVDVAAVQGDVSKRSDVEHAVAVAESMAPLRGVVHSAGVLDDASIGQQTWDRFERVLAPKVDGARHLDDLTEAMALDFFVCFSSIASLLGAPGQANHAAANSYLDALARRRVACGRPGLSINWGAWTTIGAAVDRGVVDAAGARGVGLIEPHEGFAILDRLLDGRAAQVGVSPTDWPIFLGRYTGGSIPPFFERVMPAVPGSGGPTEPDTSSRRDVRAELDAAPTHRRREMLVEYVRDCAAHVLVMPSDAIGDRAPLSDIGLDSLMAVELRNLLGASLGLERPLPATLVFDHPSVAAIAEHLARDVLALEEGSSVTVEADPTLAVHRDGRRNDLVAEIFDDLEGLSDEEIDRRFAERMR